MFLSFLILIMMIFLDLVFSFVWQDFGVTCHLTMIFFFYLAFKRGFRHLYILIFIFSVLLSGFSTLNFYQILITYQLYFIGVYFIRHQVYAESYVTHAFWVAILAMVLIFTTQFFVYDLSVNNLSFGKFFRLWSDGLVNFCMTFPVFYFLDKIYQKTNTNDQYIKRSINMLYQ